MLVFGKRVSKPFPDRVPAMAQALAVDPDSLRARRIFEKRARLRVPVVRGAPDASSGG